MYRESLGPKAGLVLVWLVGACDGTFPYHGHPWSSSNLPTEAGGPELLYHPSAFSLDVPGLVSLTADGSASEDVLTYMRGAQDHAPPFCAHASWSGTMVVHAGPNLLGEELVWERDASVSVSVRCSGEGVTEANPCGEPSSPWSVSAWFEGERSDRPPRALSLAYTVGSDGWLEGEVRVEGRLLDELSMTWPQAAVEPELWGGGPGEKEGGVGRDDVRMSSEPIHCF